MSGYNGFNDQQLTDLLRSDDGAAFKFIYQKYWEKLFVVAVKRLKDEDDAEEVVQDIFVNLWKRRKSLQIKVSFESYLAGAVKFEILKKRALNSKKTDAMNGILSNTQTQVSEHLDWNLYDMRLLQEQLQQTINSLPEKCQLVFVMSQNIELTNKQIAANLSISEKTVEKHITTALKVIKGRLGRYFFLILLLKGFI